MITQRQIPSALRVAFHAINGVGLGHVVRSICLAREMRTLLAPNNGGRGGVELLVLTNARDTSMLTAEGIDFVQLPPRLKEPHADPERVMTALPEALEDAALIGALEAFGPQLVVFDTHAPMRVVRHLPSINARSVLVLRELRPEALRSFTASGAASAFDRIVVPHDVTDEIDLGMLAEAAPVSLVGPIVRLSSPTIRDSVLGSIKRPTSRRIVAMAGGGGQPIDARRYLRAVADAHLLARTVAVPDLETIIVTGPYASELPSNIAEKYPGLSILRSTNDMTSLLATASLVISQAGYNAIAEIRVLEKPAILVPGYRKAEDQSTRAKRLVHAKAAVIAKPDARSIADCIESLITSPDALEAMTRGHRSIPLVPKNREAAIAVLAPVWRPTDRAVAKVAIVAHDFAPKLGGMESVARSLASTLIARGVATRVYTTSRLGARTASKLGDGVVEALYEPLPPPQRIDLENDLLATIEMALRDSPDVIHLCHAGLGPWIPILRAAFPSCIVTANVHGNDLLVPWVHHGDVSVSDYRKSQIDGLSSADAVVCVSQFSHALAKSNGINAAVLHTIENGVDPSRFLPSVLPAPHHDDDEVVLTVSRLAPRKGHRTVLEAIALLAKDHPRLKYVFTGASETMRAELMHRARELGIASRVVATGFVPDADLPSLYAASRVFILLSEEDAQTDVEGFGVALLEAAASGLPTIASRTGGVPEAIADGITGVLVPPGDARAAANAIARFLTNRDEAKTFGARGRARVIDSFSHERAADRILSLWNEILPRQREPAERGRAGKGVEVVRAAQQHAAKKRAERQNRRATFRSVVERGQIVRLRATGDGARLLPEVLDDCAALGHAPRVEVKLRRFLEADFVHALVDDGLVSEVELAHGVPHESAASILDTLKTIPLDAIKRIRIVRLFLTPEARADARLAARAVPETHALRRFFAEHAAILVPPPELMRYLSEVPANGPDTGMIEPTNLCNLACPTCPTGTGKIKPLPQMTLEKFDRVIDELDANVHGNKMRNLALWNYGEPLLNKELPLMIAHAKDRGVGVVKVSSNVHFLDGARGLALLKSGLDVLILSVDGASQATYETFRKDGDFERVATSVAWLCAEKKRLGLAKPRIELQFIAMRHNEHELPEMRRLAREWGVDKLRVKTVGADDDASKDLVPTSRLLSRYEADHTTPNVRHAFCTMAWDHTVVNVDGSITPCCYLRPDMGDEFVMGNIFETSFAAIWRGEKYRAFRASMLDGRESMPVCNRCRGGTHDLVAATEDVPSS